MPETDMTPRSSNAVQVTLSEGALEDFEEVANAFNTPLATYLRIELEQVHRSPSFGALLRRVRAGKKLKSAIALLRENPDGLSAGQVQQMLDSLSSALRKDED